MTDALRIRVESLVAAHGGVRNAARALDIDPSYLVRLARGDRLNPSETILEKLGLRRVVTYERIRTREATQLSPHIKCA